MDILLQYPKLVVQNKDCTQYDGYISVQNEDFHIYVDYPADITKARFLCDWKLKCLLIDCLDILQQRLNQCGSLTEFLQEMERIIEKAMETKQTMMSQKEPVSCGKIISEIDNLGWDKLVTIDAQFTWLEFVYTDSRGRCHYLKVKLHPKHPEEKPECVTKLPVPFNPHWTIKTTLQSLYEQFSHSVESFQSFWNNMETLDKHTWVLEPDSPNFSAVYRRIAVSSSASLQITVDPKQPNLLPDCRFLGADHSIKLLKQTMNSNMYNWNPEVTLLDNLQTLLDIQFPSPSTSKKEEFSMDCGICYSYKLDTELPSEVCNDSRCQQAFHHSCLFEWLRSSGCRQSFNTIFGECPYCSKPITVKMVTS